MRHNLYLVSAPIIIDNIRLVSYPAIIALLIAAAIIDIKEHRIPDILVFFGAAAGLAFSLFDFRRGLWGGFIGGITAGLVLLLIYYIAKGGLGMGDVKLFGCVGIYLGFPDTVSAMLIASILSGLFSLVLICVKRVNRKLELPFAPFILIGVLAVIILD